MTADIALAGAHGAIPGTQSSRDEATDRASRIRMGLVEFAGLLREIATAYQRRDWATLGYATWDAYVGGEFGEHKVMLSREDRERAVTDLRGAGLSTRAIASALGVGQTQVRRDIAAAGEPNGSPEITGADGKRYAATRPPAPAQLDPGEGEASPAVGGGDAAVGPVGPGPTATLPAADGERSHRPRVLVMPAVADGPDAGPREAELWEDQNDRATVKVVFLASRTSAWVLRDRIQPLTCEQCAGDITTESAAAGYLRCEDCDAEGEHYTRAGYGWRCVTCLPIDYDDEDDDDEVPVTTPAAVVVDDEDDNRPTAADDPVTPDLAAQLQAHADRRAAERAADEAPAAADEDQADAADRPALTAATVRAAVRAAGVLGQLRYQADAVAEVCDDETWQALNRVSGDIQVLLARARAAWVRAGGAA